MDAIEDSAYLYTEAIASTFEDSYVICYRGFRKGLCFADSCHIGLPVTNVSFRRVFSSFRTNLNVRNSTSSHLFLYGGDVLRRYFWATG